VSKTLAAGSGLLSIAAVMLALWTAAENRALRRQLEDERILAPRDGAALTDPASGDAAADGATLPAAAGPVSLPERLAALEARVSRLPEPDPDAPAPLAPLPAVPQVPSSEPAPAAPGGVVTVPSAAAPGAAPDGRSKAAIEKEVKDAVAKELESIKRREKKAASFTDFAKELELNERQQIEVQDELARMQLEVLGLLRTPTQSGHVPLDYLLEAWSDPDRDAARRKYRSAVDALKQTKLPGTEQTYQEHIDALKASVHKPFERVMTKEQYAVWKSWELDPSRISWTDSPFHQELTVVTEAMRKRRVAESKAAGGDGTGDGK
jgi:hypothetical protein